jgi:hypothetical protein
MNLPGQVSIKGAALTTKRLLSINRPVVCWPIRAAPQLLFPRQTSVTIRPLALNGDNETPETRLGRRPMLNLKRLLPITRSSIPWPIRAAPDLSLIREL